MRPTGQWGYTRVVNPNRKLTPFITKLTGIRDCLLDLLALSTDEKMKFIFQHLFT